MNDIQEPKGTGSEPNLDQPTTRVAKLEKRKRKSRLREGLDWVITLVLAMAMAFFLRLYVVEFITVEGPSMEPTLVSDERVLIDKGIYNLFCTPQRGEIVVTHFPGEKDIFIKRIVGLPGERLEIRGGQVYIDDQPLDEPYIAAPMLQDYDEIVIPEGHYMVMGDNRNNSHDSRASVVGPIPRDLIVGRAVAISWPLDAWRGLLP